MLWRPSLAAHSQSRPEAQASFLVAIVVDDHLGWCLWWEAISWMRSNLLGWSRAGLPQLWQAWGQSPPDHPWKGNDHSHAAWVMLCRDETEGNLTPDGNMRAIWGRCMRAIWVWGQPGCHVKGGETLLISSVEVCSALHEVFLRIHSDRQIILTGGNVCWWLFIMIIRVMVTLMRIGTSTSWLLITAWKYDSSVW